MTGGTNPESEPGPLPRARKSRRVVGGFMFIFAFLMLGAAATVLWGYQQFHADGPLSAETLVRIPPGASLAEIGNLFERQGIVRHAHLFVIGVRVAGDAGKLRAGEFNMPARTSMLNAARIAVSGAFHQRYLSIPEGLAIKDILGLIAAVPALTGTVPEIDGEGDLLPETYAYQWGESRTRLIARMRNAMEKALDRAWREAPTGHGLATKDDAVVLASIIEKETAVPGERRLISGVFHNRLKRGMPLQSDPTVVYALRRADPAFDRPLTRRDLTFVSEFNTYLNKGLPPAPIAMPGLAAIRAALNPARTKAIYFVADGSGGHAFAETLKEHNRNVANWRRVRRHQEQK